MLGLFVGLEYGILKLIASVVTSLTVPRVTDGKLFTVPETEIDWDDAPDVTLNVPPLAPVAAPLLTLTKTTLDKTLPEVGVKLIDELYEPFSVLEI